MRKKRQFSYISKGKATKGKSKRSKRQMNCEWPVKFANLLWIVVIMRSCPVACSLKNYRNVSIANSGKHTRHTHNNKKANRVINQGNTISLWMLFNTDSTLTNCLIELMLIVWWLCENDHFENVFPFCSHSLTVFFCYRCFADVLMTLKHTKTKLLRFKIDLAVAFIESMIKGRKKEFSNLCDASRLSFVRSLLTPFSSHFVFFSRYLRIFF